MRDFLKNFKAQFFDTVKNNVYLIKFVTSKKHGKTYVFLKAVSALIAALFPIILTVFPGLIINELIYDRNIAKIVCYTAVIVLCPALNQVFNISIGRLVSRIEKELHLQTALDFYWHLSQLEIEFRENPDVSTKGDIARDTLENAAGSIHLVFGLLSSVIGLLALIAIVSILNPFIMALVIINVILSSVITKRANDKQNATTHGGEVFLLDEPTAALDPISEYEIYEQFNEMIGNRCAVLITHRLSAVQLADKVAVFDQGSVVEYGTHTELYARGGIYTEMFDKQAKFYRDNPGGEPVSEEAGD